jgi:EAL domain-containing protein (putative c-di-GMP-specific phosphodiesterase class I)
MSRTRIVAVDDDRRILRVLKRSCEGIGYEVHSVLDAEFFESSFRVFEPSLVFLDLNMRNIDGVELLRFIAEERSETSVIVTSGVDERLLGAAHSLGLSLGLDMLDPIRKPLMVSDIRRRLKTFRDRPARKPDRSIEKEKLRDAIDQGLVDVCYQPMVKLATGQVICVEALARVRQPGTGILVPDQFIAVAERYGLIEDLTFCVLERALTDLCAWNDTAPELQVSVNMSPMLLDDIDLPDRVEDLLQKYRVSPNRLVVEVTETRAPDDRQRMADTLSRLRLKGMRLALDDFGTGFCSLGQLYEFPYETLKLDKKFAMRAPDHEDAAAMIRSSLDLARSVGLTVVAEGIQSEDTLRWLEQMGCDAGQGFHISPPLSAAAFRDWLERPDPAATGLGAPQEAHHIAG